MLNKTSIFTEDAENIMAKANAFESDGALAFIGQISGLSEPVATIANAVAVLATKADDDFDMAPNVSEMIIEGVVAIMRAAELFEEVEAAIQASHGDQIERILNATTASRKWDVRANQDEV